MTEASVDSDFLFDPLDTSKTKDFDLMARIRRQRPVCRPAEGIVFTSKYEDTARTFKNAKRFSSAGDMRAPGVVVQEEESFLGELDAPLHPRIRRLLLRGFTLQNAAAAEPWTRGEVRRRLEGMRSRRGGDLMADLAIPLPGSVAAHALGVPDDRHDEVMHWCNELLHSPWPSTGKTERGVGIEGAFPEFAALIDGFIAERREEGPGQPDDLLAVMVRTRDADGWHISEHHVRTLTINILAGSLSASYMIGNLLYRYLEDESGFAALLRADRSKVPAAVEESLRLEAPVTFLTRAAREDTTIGGCPVRAGDHIMLGIASANRDETVYEDAGEFRLDRTEKPEHLAFGAGPHLCLGNHLTRMAGKVVLEEIIDGFEPGEIQLVPDFRWECVDHIQEYGPETLEVTIGR
jgi:cytochrome P450